MNSGNVFREIGIRKTVFGKLGVSGKRLVREIGIRENNIRELVCFVKFGNSGFGKLGFGIQESVFREIRIRENSIREIGCFGKTSFSGNWHSGNLLREK